MWTYNRRVEQNGRVLAGQMKILSLITHLRHVVIWEQATTRIDEIYPQWPLRSVVQRALAVASVAPAWDRIVFFYDFRLPVLVWLLALVLHRSDIRERIVFTTFLCDTRSLTRLTRFLNVYNLGRYLYMWTFVRLCRVIVVHSSAEIAEYSKVFRVSPTRFCFLHYSVRDDALVDTSGHLPAPRDARVVAVGRHRDWETFLRAISGTEISAVIVAGASDAKAVKRAGDMGVDVHIEAPFPQYRELIRRAGVCVVPLGTTMVRSLGQVAVLEAVAARTPVIVARVSQLTDYFEDEILFYRPGDSEDLRAKLRQALTATQASNERTEAAFLRMMREYTTEKYAHKLLNLCGCAERPEAQPIPS